MSINFITNEIFKFVSGFYQLLKKILIPFLFVTFIIYSLLYIIPGSKKFVTDIVWPLSYLVWVADFFSGSLFKHGIGTAYFYTLQLVLGSLILSGIIVVILYFLGRRGKGYFIKFFERFVKISSGFHVLILSIAVYMLFPSLRNAGPLNPIILLILAFGNGSIAEFYNSLEAEYDKVFQKEYTLAAVAWGHNVYRYSLREMVIIFIELFNARIPIAISSTIVVEYLFSLNGLSYMILNSIKNREYHELMITTALIALTIITLNVLTEKIRQQLDPRVRSL